MWKKRCQIQGSKQSSSHASGALFLYLFVPSSIQDIARRAAQIDDFGEASTYFCREAMKLSSDAQLAAVLLDAARAGEEEHGEKKRAMPAKSG